MARKWKPEDWKRGDTAWFDGKDVHGRYNGSGEVTIDDPHANSIRVTHTADDGREYEGTHRHIRTALIKTSRGKIYEVPTFYLRKRRSNPGTKALGSRSFNPRDPEMRRAAKLYESFRERTPQRIKKIGVNPPPRIAVDIGYVEYIGYRTTHGKKLTLYQHDFAPGSRPLLCVSPDGRQLLLIGGRYVFTERGIVDRDIDGREIDNPDHGAVMRSNPRRRLTSKNRAG